jgi:hypothetical protein
VIAEPQDVIWVLVWTVFLFDRVGQGTPATGVGIATAAGPNQLITRSVIVARPLQTALRVDEETAVGTAVAGR